MLIEAGALHLIATVKAHSGGSCLYVTASVKTLTEAVALSQPPPFIGIN
jgi:hypothetical protein